jgi:hypothetical protein
LASDKGVVLQYLRDLGVDEYLIEKSENSTTSEKYCGTALFRMTSILEFVGPIISSKEDVIVAILSLTPKKTKMFFGILSSKRGMTPSTVLIYIFYISDI